MVLNFGVVAHTLDLTVPEASRKKLEPMVTVNTFLYKVEKRLIVSVLSGVG